MDAVADCFIPLRRDALRRYPFIWNDLCEWLPSRDRLSDGLIGPSEDRSLGVMGLISPHRDYSLERLDMPRSK
jgi:hypothetical protein